MNGYQQFILENSASLGLASLGLVAGSDFGAVSVSVSAVPEPSTYAAIAGLGVFGFAAYRRRHRQTV
jgi:hypothetical protein